MAEINELAKALAAFQAEVVTVGKGADNPFFKSKYAELGSIMKKAQPVLTKHGLSVVQLPDNLDGQAALTTILMHTSGQSLRATVPLVLSKQDPQGFGSAMTYFRRYGYAAALQIVIDEDDDGNNASHPKTQVSNSWNNKPAKLTGMATDKQRETISKELGNIGVSLEQTAGYLMETYGVNVPLDKESASFVIDDLFEQKGYQRQPDKAIA